MTGRLAMSGRPGRNLRIRYLIAGAVLAVLWVGHAGEPAWAHALRLGLVLVTVRPLMLMTRRFYMRHWDSEASQTRAIVVLIVIRLLALAGALVVGTLIEQWVTHRSDSVHLLTVLRFLLLVATIPIQLRLMRRRGPAAAAALGRVRWNWLLLVKAGLVAVALGAQVLLEMWLGRPADYIVAVGLLVAVAVLGLRLHRRLFGRAAAALRPAPDDGIQAPGAGAGVTAVQAAGTASAGPSPDGASAPAST